MARVQDARDGWEMKKKYAVAKTMAAIAVLMVKVDLGIA
jgi:hypothetical protein